MDSPTTGPLSDDQTVDFVGGDPDSKDLECAAVFVTDDGFYQQGKLVTDPLTLAKLEAHSPLGVDEAVVWQPARLRCWPMPQPATTRKDRVGHGKLALVDLIKAARYSVVHLEQRDNYTDEPDLLAWRASGKQSPEENMRASMADWMEFVRDIVGRGVAMRRARIVSEPLSDYIQWERELASPISRAVDHLRPDRGPDHDRHDTTVDGGGPS